MSERRAVFVMERMGKKKKRNLLLLEFSSAFANLFLTNKNFMYFQWSHSESPNAAEQR